MLVHNRCEFADRQIVRLQETPGTFSPILPQVRQLIDSLDRRRSRRSNPSHCVSRSLRRARRHRQTRRPCHHHRYLPFRPRSPQPQAASHQVALQDVHRRPPRQEDGQEADGHRRLDTGSRRSSRCRRCRYGGRRRAARRSRRSSRRGRRRHVRRWRRQLRRPHFFRPSQAQGAPRRDLPSSRYLRLPLALACAEYLRDGRCQEGNPPSAVRWDEQELDEGWRSGWTEVQG